MSPSCSAAGGIWASLGHPKYGPTQQVPGEHGFGVALAMLFGLGASVGSPLCPEKSRVKEKIQKNPLHLFLYVTKALVISAIQKKQTSFLPQKAGDCYINTRFSILTIPISILFPKKQVF